MVAMTDCLRCNDQWNLSLGPWPACPIPCQTCGETNGPEDLYGRYCASASCTELRHRKVQAWLKENGIPFHLDPNLLFK